MSAFRPHVTIIGGGVIGCWSAYYLAQKGCRVTLVERNSIGSGASSGNCGYLCPSHVMPLCGPGAIRHALPHLLRRDGALSVPARFDPTLWRWLMAFPRYCTADHQTKAAVARDRLLKSSAGLYAEYLADRGAECRWDSKGLLLVHRGQKTLDGFQATADRLASEFDIHPVRLEGAALVNHEPTLIDSLAGGWLFPADTHLDPARLMQRLHQDLRDLNVEIMQNTEVLRMDMTKGKVGSLKTSSGDLKVEQLVLATGAETPRFASDLKCRIPVVPGKGYSMTFGNADENTTASWPQVPMIFEDTHVAITPFGEELRVGSTMQLTGYDRTIDPRRLQMIRNDAQSYLRHPIVGDPHGTWVGWRPMSVDDIPCIDRAPAVENAWVATGNGMVGMSTGTASGHLIADLICGDTPVIDPRPYSLSRFGRLRQSKPSVGKPTALPA